MSSCVTNIQPPTSLPQPRPRSILSNKTIIYGGLIGGALLVVETAYIFSNVIQGKLLTDIKYVGQGFGAIFATSFIEPFFSEKTGEIAKKYFPKLSSFKTIFFTRTPIHVAILGALYSLGFPKNSLLLASVYPACKLMKSYVDSNPKIIKKMKNIFTN